MKQSDPGLEQKKKSLRYALNMLKNFDLAAEMIGIASQLVSSFWAWTAISRKCSIFIPGMHYTTKNHKTYEDSNIFLAFQ